MKDAVKLQNLEETFNDFLVKCALIDCLLIIAGKDAVMIRTARSVFMPEIIWGESDSELSDLTAGIQMLSYGLSLVLLDGVIKN